MSFDTRTKIVSAETLLRTATKALRVVSGFFDPLTAAHVRRLRELAAPDSALAVMVTDPPEPLLEARARAELVAALNMVDYVVLADDGAWNLPDRFREESADEARRCEFVRRVRERHGS